MRKRRAVTGVLAAAPVAIAVVVVACTELPADAPAPSDPAAIWGAEVSVTVIGSGSVTSDLTGIACPPDCAARWVFADADKPPRGIGLTLTAIPATPDVFFEGWTFFTTPVATNGRGAASCNPISRAAVAPPVDPQLPVIILPFGEVDGDPPAGQADLCSDVITVPLAYEAVAQFSEVQPPIDASVDDVLFDPPEPGAIGFEIGLAGANQRLYWRWGDALGHHGIASGFTAGALSKAPTVLVPPRETITRFAIGPHVVYQTPTGLRVIVGGEVASRALPFAPQCVAVASDATRVYCRTVTGALYAWDIGGAGPVLALNNLSPGASFAVDDTFYYYVVDANGPGNASIRRAPKTPGDAATPFVELATGLTGPTDLATGLDGITWFERDASGVGVAYTASTSIAATRRALTPPIAGLVDIAADPSSSTTLWCAADDTTLGGVILESFGAPDTTTYWDSGLPDGARGIAVGPTAFYWTARDGRVRTQPTN